MDYQAPVYDLLTAAARGRLGIDLRLLHAVLDRGDAAIPDLVRFAASDFRSLPINLEEDLIAMFRHLRTDEAIPFFVDVVRAEPLDVPDMLVDAVVGLGAPALEPFLELYHSLEEDEAEEAAFILAALRIRDPRVLQILLDRLEYDAMEGALALGVYGDPAAIPELRTMLAEILASDTHLRHALDSEIKALEQPPADHASDPPYDIWGAYPEEARPDIDLLSETERLELLSSESAETRVDAAHSFFNVSFSTAVRAKLLELARGDDSATVRARAWETLLDAADEPEVRKSMLAVIENPDAVIEEKGGALVGLAHHSENPKVRAAMEEFYKIPELRAKAMEAMWRSLDRTFAQYFPKHVDDPDREVQQQAIRGIGYLGIHSETKKLEQFFDDEDLRPDALFAYALSVPAEISPGRVQTLLRKIEGLAAGLSEGESSLVKMALDDRLMLHGDRPVFFSNEEELDEPEVEQAVSDKVGRNEPCPCGSGKKYKKCCGAA